jgi:hypothetical protein
MTSRDEPCDERQQPAADDTAPEHRAKWMVDRPRAKFDQRIPNATLKGAGFDGQGGK